MPNPDPREKIKEALHAFTGDGALDDLATKLLAEIGYQSERTFDRLTGKVDEFLANFNGERLSDKERKLIKNSWQRAYFLFQFTDEEIKAAGAQGSLGFKKKAADFRPKEHSSFVFIAVDLKEKQVYPRGALARMTRAINQLFAMPAIVIFRSSSLLTLSVIHRRINKRRRDLDVLEKVTLLRNIDAEKPHRAHLDILASLSLAQRLEWIEEHRRQNNFEGLQAAWAAALNTHELNKLFYHELLRWFEQAKRKVQFPSPPATEQKISPEQHVIRLTTRLLFIWFIKEKGLVADDLFNEDKIGILLKSGEDDSAYYRAILQNLFFATLNTEIDKRRFSRKKDSDHRNFNVYRYEDLIADKETFLELMNKTPFINGGLFDCLDSFTGARAGGYRIDCFSDKHRERLSVPDSLFFGTGGLIPLLQKYKFTIEESTPIEEDVALDPELLGRVFENLLATVNPETGGDEERKKTGSFYTPRDVVDYMVEEALIGYLTEKVGLTGAKDRTAIRNLLSYRHDDDTTAGKEFDTKTKKKLVWAIGDVKLLDPAVGSGAFPMGALHKLSLVLSRLDPDNTLWQAYQKERAVSATTEIYNTHPAGKEDDARTLRVAEISETFKNYSSEFGRKLFLIQNSIFGVDIQSIAVQIAKLRFFITLAIEQEPNANVADNYKIRPLPNLETRFVTADTLIPLLRQQVIGNDKISAVKKELKLTRESYFNAQSRRKKISLMKKDERLRGELMVLLEESGFPKEEASKVAHWQPYGETEKADWFDPEWMFGEASGFDIVIGNPPYVRHENIKPTEYKDKIVPLYKDSGVVKKSDLYVYFYSRGINLLRMHGTLVFICSNSWLDVDYGKELRKHLLKHTNGMDIHASCGVREFETADISTVVSILRRGTPNDSTANFFSWPEDIGKNSTDTAKPPRVISCPYMDLRSSSEKWGGMYLRAPDIYHTILEKGKDKLVTLGLIADVRFGIKTGANKFFHLTAKEADEWGIEKEFLQPILKSPKECKRPQINLSDLSLFAFICHKSKGELEGSNALKYIQWGEREKFHQVSSVGGRSQWWTLGNINSPIVWPCTMNPIFKPLYNPSKLMIDKVFYGIEHHDPKRLLTCILSYFVALQAEVMGYALAGGGGNFLTVDDIAGLYVIRPDLLPPVRNAYLTKERARYFDECGIDYEVDAFSQTATPTPDREEMDKPVFDIIGLTADERREVYRATCELVQDRINRAKGTAGD